MRQEIRDSVVIVDVLDVLFCVLYFGVDVLMCRYASIISTDTRRWIVVDVSERASVLMFQE